MKNHTFMKQEVLEIPSVINQIISHSTHDIKYIAQRLNEQNIPYIATIARGSSDHAASYLKYAIELMAGIPVASIGPSVSSVFNKQLNLAGAACISISQSGQSPDILSATEMAMANGATSIAITNNQQSPLSKSCDYSIDICAGVEKSVAATKTFVSSIISGLLLIAYWKNDKPLLEAIHALPDQASDALECNWDALVEAVNGCRSLFTIGRGPAWAISNEAALKFKETCQIHAESYSSAEVMHGPKTIIGPQFPIVAFASRDATEASLIEAVNQLSDQGGQCFVTSDIKCKGTKLPFVSSGHPLTDPLLLIISFYNFVEKLALAKGLNPDEPPHLKKVTETV